MKSITIRGVDERLNEALASYANKEHSSINRTILSLLRKALKIDEFEQFPEYDDLDDLAGTWSKEDEEGFTAATSDFDKIDEEIWR